MGIFQQFPYSNFHEMNLDSLLKLMKELQDEWEATKTQWNSYKDYIDNYFNNLNLDAETEKALRALIADGTLDPVIDPVIIQQVTTWLENNITPTTPAVDKSLTIGDAAAEAKETGTRLESLRFTMEICSDIVIPNILHDHYWSTADGSLGDSASYMCSPNIIPVTPGLYVSEINQNCTLTFFDSERQYMHDYLTLRPANGTNTIFQLIPEDVKYVGVTTANDAGITSLRLRKIKGVDALQAPFANGGDYVFIDNGIYSDTGTFTASTSFMSTLFPVKAGEKYVTNAKYAQNFCCWDSDNNVLGPAAHVDLDYGIGVLTVPANSAKMAFNIQKSHIHGSSTDYSTVLYKLTKSEKILAIGDSITWLNNHNGYDGSNKFWGWQKTVEREGYQIVTEGFSGYPVADDGEHDCIYDAVVTDQLDVTGYDIIIFFAGTNDNLYEIPVGNPLNTYYKTSFDSTVFTEAYAGILRYIRDNNTTCKIILVTPLKSEAAIRNYNKAIPYINAIRQLAEVYACEVCDTFKTMNVSPNTVGFPVYFYDNTHPNRAGMERVGKQILQAVEDC